MTYPTERTEPSKGSRRVLPDGRQAVAMNTHAVKESVYYEIEGGNGAGGWMSYGDWERLEARQ